MSHSSSRKFLWLTIIVSSSLSLCYSATVDIHPGQDIPTIVAENPSGTIFVIYPGTYRLTKAIIPKAGDSFIGETACAPPKTSCPAIISGSRVIGPLATFNGTNYEVTNQTQQGQVATPIGKEILCDSLWQGCVYPEDLFFDGVPYQHLKSSTLPTIGSKQWWFDYPNHTIYFHDNPSGHTVETSVVQNAFGGNANNVTIKYLTVKEFAALYPDGAIGVSQGSRALTDGTHWTVANCEILLNHGWGVRVGYKISILNNYIHNNGQAAIGGGLGLVSVPATQSANSGILIQGNLITYNDFAHFNPDFGAGGIKTGATSGITIRANTISHNEGAAVHFDDNSSSELLDGNTITENTDSDGVDQEMGVGTSIFRNNYVARNGTHVNDNYSTGQLASHASTGVDAYCNVIEIQPGRGVNGWMLGASNRGYSKYPPYGYLVTTGSAFHHNTLIWDEGATGASGYWQDDSAHQPMFFQNNARPDYNDYHLASTSPIFVYDHNDTQKNSRKSFPEYQSAEGDIHGRYDMNNHSGFPTVVITSPLDRSSFSTALRVTATAADKSGINRMELYVDWVLKQTLAGSPFTFDLDSMVAPLTRGSHTLTAMAYSNAGIRNCYAITLNKQ
jgi:hypothetical protein